MKILKSEKLQIFLDYLFMVILFLYPMRHVNIGIDLWDTGYSYANFTYMGMKHMDSMWLFSTYLANVLGHLFTMFPAGNTMVGLNIYTGLMVSGLACMGYYFVTRYLKVEKWIAFLGEMIAVSLCWCPTAKLYDYLGYVLFLACVIQLYKGLTMHKSIPLVVAGVCLGLNVFVRFSNLPQMVLIVLVWAYSTMEELELGKAKKPGEVLKASFIRGLGYTEWCVAGYLAVVIAMFGYLHIRYGLPDYFAGISRLFSMTENAADYKASAMVFSLVKTYWVNTYWLIRLLLIAAAGMVVWGLFQNVLEKLPVLRERETVKKIFYVILCLGWGAVCAGVIVWLWMRHFFSFYYYSYDSMLLPGILFLMLTMLIALIKFISRKSAKEERLLAGLVIMVVIVTSIGSNNNVYPSLNNLFLAAPYTFWQAFLFIRNTRPIRLGKWQLICSAAKFKGVLMAVLGLFIVQSVLFGTVFVFAEATGVQEPTAYVKGNSVLRGMKMNPERAQWMQELTDYVNGNDLEGREVILYGRIPALSYYLQMPSAFNPWPDLASYSLETMQADLEKTCQKVENEEMPRPVVIAEKVYGEYALRNKLGLILMGLDEDYMQTIMDDPKWRMITDYMRDYGYRKTFENDKFVIWE